MIKNFKWLFLVSLAFAACNSDDETAKDNNSSDGLPLTSGLADFTKYVALGDYSKQVRKMHTQIFWRNNLN